MKAVDYVVNFVADGRTVQALAKVVLDMMEEVRTIGIQRKVSTDDGLFSILDEMDAKFKSFHRQVEGKLDDNSLIHPESFKRMIRLKMPDVFSAWNSRRGGHLLAS